jgi:hypothetical protein
VTRNKIPNSLPHRLSSPNLVHLPRTIIIQEDIERAVCIEYCHVLMVQQFPAFRSHVCLQQLHGPFGVPLVP